jgi:threonine/homoserine/homoserine lactone efflux protein
MQDFICPLLVFAFAASFTPGPNVVMPAASGANYDFRSTIPHIGGISVGFPIMVIAVGVGVRRVATERALRIFNWTMAALPVASLIPVFAE